MKRIQEIERKMNRYFVDWYKDTAECIKDINYLLAENKRYKEVLKNIRNHLPNYENEKDIIKYRIGYITEQSLKEE